MVEWEGMKREASEKLKSVNIAVSGEEGLRELGELCGWKLLRREVQEML